jgi:hypothetical protein
VWTCPHCRRRFGRSGQGHDCAPAMTLDEYFETGPAFERPVYEAVQAHLDTIEGPATYVEPVSVGLFFKHGSRTFLQLRPMTRWVAAGFVLDRKLDHDRLARKVVGEGSRWYHVVNLRGPEEVDDLVRGWITEAYLAAEG